MSADARFVAFTSESTDLVNGSVDTNQDTGQAHLRQAACAWKLQQNDLVHFRLPILFRPTAKVTASDKSGFVVIRTVICCAGVRNIDDDHWNSGFPIFVSNDRRDRLVSLKFDGKINFFANQKVGVALRSFSAIPIVEGNKFNAFFSCCALEASGNFS